jgi:hypothetical protein
MLLMLLPLYICPSISIFSSRLFYLMVGCSSLAPRQSTAICSNAHFLPPIKEMVFSAFLWLVLQESTLLSYGFSRWLVKGGCEHERGINKLILGLSSLDTSNNSTSAKARRIAFRRGNLYKSARRLVHCPRDIDAPCERKHEGNTHQRQANPQENVVSAVLSEPFKTLARGD